MAKTKSTFLSIIDIFKNDPIFFIQNRQRISTNVSQFFTIIFFIVVIIIVYQESYHRIRKSDFQFKTMQQVVTKNDQNFNLNKYDTMIAFRIETSQLHKNLTKYFNFEFENWTWNYNTNEYELQKLFQAEQCTLEHFDKSTANQFRDLALQDAFCLPQNYTAIISKQSIIQSELSLRLKYCNPINDQQCIDLSQIDNQNQFKADFGKSFYFDTFYVIQFFKIQQDKFSIFLYQFYNQLKQVTNFDPTNSTIPITKSIDVIFSELDIQQQLFQRAIFPVSAYKFQDYSNIYNGGNHPSDLYDGLFLDLNLIRDTYAARSPNEQNSILFQINFSNSLKIETYSRQYPDMIDILIRIAGSSKIFMIVLSLIATLYNEDYYLHKLLKYTLNIKMVPKFSNFIFGKTLEDLIDTQKYKKVQNSVDIKTLILMNSKIRLIFKLLLSKKSQLLVKIMTKTHKSYNVFLNYFIKKNKQYQRQITTGSRKKQVIQLIQIQRISFWNHGINQNKSLNQSSISNQHQYDEIDKKFMNLQKQQKEFFLQEMINQFPKDNKQYNDSLRQMDVSTGKIFKDFMSKHFSHEQTFIDDRQEDSTLDHENIQIQTLPQSIKRS